MKPSIANSLCVFLFSYTLAWTSSGWCEEKDLDPKVINDWIRSTVVSNSDGSEIKRVLRISKMGSWDTDNFANQVRYEVNNSDCQRTITFDTTDLRGVSRNLDWVKLIEHHKQNPASELEKPIVLVKVTRAVRDYSPILDLNVEYQVQDGMPVLVVDDQQDVDRMVREFKSAVGATVRISAFELQYSFALDLTYPPGFKEKLDWSNEHCPLSEEQEESNVLPPGS